MDKEICERAVQLLDFRKDFRNCMYRKGVHLLYDEKK